MSNSEGKADRITIRQAKRKKKRVKNWIVKAIAVAVVVYLALSIVFSFYSGMTTTIALNGTVTESIYTEGYVFRKQSLINSPAAGYIECRADEGERVSSGQTIAYIYTGEYDKDNFMEIQELNDRIEYLEGNSSASMTYAGNGVMVEQKIGVASRNLSDKRQEHNMNNSAEAKENINILIGRRNAIENGSTVDRDEELTLLKNRLSELESEIGGAKIVIKAETNGIFSSKIDGFEDKLSMDALGNITPSYLNELDGMKEVQNDSVVENAPVCKIIDNYEWYYGVNIEAEEAKKLQIGQRVELKLHDSSDSSVYGNIRAVSSEENGKCAVTIFANRYAEGIYTSSRVSAEIITTKVDGVKLPVRSLHVKDDKTGVYVLRLDVARFVPVNVHYKNDEWAIVSAVTDTGNEYKLQIYDEVIVDAKRLEDGKVVR